MLIAGITMDEGYEERMNSLQVEMESQMQTKTMDHRLEESEVSDSDSAQELVVCHGEDQLEKIKHLVDLVGGLLDDFLH
jgi:hypothetical protein